MKRPNNQRSGLIALLIFFIIVASISTPVIAQDGQHHGEGPGYGNDINNPPNSESNNSPNEPSGFDNQHNWGKTGENQSDSNHEQQNQYQKQGDQNDKGYGQQQKRHQYRKMNCTGDQKQYRIRSQWKLNNSTDAFEIDFTTNPEPSLTLNYMPTGNASNIQLNFKIILKKIVEFSDLNNNKRYDYSDVVVSTYAFNLQNFTDITYSNETLSSGENIVRMATKTADDVFSIDMLISDNFTLFNNLLISPSEMKIDFIIQNYLYMKNNTQLALLLEVNTNHYLTIEEESFDEKNGFATNETAVNISSMHYCGFFSWLNTACIDGSNKSVQASVFEEGHLGIKGIENVTYIAISYPRGTEIIHDPKIGVVSQSFALLSLGDSNLINLVTEFNVYLTYIISCVLAILLFLGIIIIRKRL